MPLTPEQRLERLEERLAELAFWRVREQRPVEGWTANGEPIAVGDRWPRGVDLVRFAAAAEVPAHWPLDESRLSLDLGGESLLTLSYDGGEAERFGLDPNHQLFPLRARRLGVAAESVARQLFGQPVAEPKLATAALLWLDMPVRRLETLLKLVAESVAALAGHEVVPHLLALGEAALSGLDWPSTTADYLARVAPSREQQSIWRRPPTIADPAPLNQAERAGVVAARERLVEGLRALQTRFPPQGEVAMTGHAHIDLAWLWPYDETRRKLRRTFSTALALLDRSPDFRFNQSTAQFYAQLEDDDPALLQRIRAAAKDGRWETIGGMWVEPDANMPSGESLSRQILYGQRYFERMFGARHKVCWLPDCFGFSPALPQLLRQGGMDSFSTTKTNWSETNRFPHDLFWWEGLDGSRVLAHTFANPMSGYNGDVRPGCIAPTWKNFRGKVAHRQTLLSVGFGDGGGGVTPEMIERETALRDFPALPRARWASVHGFFAEAHRASAASRLPVWLGEIYLERHRATLTTQSGTKRRLRRAEQGLVAAEVAASLGHMLGAASPPSLESAWRLVLKNEFHDILPGSSIREVYEDAEAELDSAIAAADAAREAGLDAIRARLPRGEAAEALLVVNPSLSERPLRASLADGARLASADMIPPLSVVVLDRAKLKSAPRPRVGRDHLENETLLARLGADGMLTSLVHKPSGREALAGRGNQLWLYPQDKPRDWDAWDIEEDYATRGEEWLNLENLAVVEETPERVALRLERRWRSSRIVQTLSLDANGRRLDVATALDWRDRRVLLRTLTPAAVRAPFAVCECAYGIIRRPTHANTSWEAAMFEAPAHRFVDLSEPGFGLAILNDCKYGHSVTGGVLGLSLVRSPVYPDPNADEGEQSFAYALMPHSGDWFEGGVREEAEDLNQPLLIAAAPGLAPGDRSPLRFSGLQAGLSALKRAEDGDGLILRVYEPAGARGPFAFAPPPGWREAGGVSLLEEPAAREAPHDLMPFEVRSWRLRRT